MSHNFFSFSHILRSCRLDYQFRFWCPYVFAHLVPLDKRFGIKSGDLKDWHFTFQANCCHCHLSHLESECQRAANATFKSKRSHCIDHIDFILIHFKLVSNAPFVSSEVEVYASQHKLDMNSIKDKC